MQVLPIDFTAFGTWNNGITILDGYVYDGNELSMINIEQNNCFYQNVTGGEYFEIINLTLHGVANHGLGLLYNAATGNESVVKNLTVACDINSSTNKGVVLSENNTSVFYEDIIFTGNVVNSFSSNPDVVNGLLGTLTNGGIKNCLLDSMASFSVYSRLTGFVRVLTSSTMENCVNKAAMYAENIGQAANNCRISGLFDVATDSLIKNCKNYSNIVGITGFTWKGAIGINISGTTVVEDCENHGDNDAFGFISGIGVGCLVKNCANYGNTQRAALGNTVSGTVDGFINYGIVDTTRNAAGIIVTLNGIAKNIINYGKFISKNDGSGPANQNGAGLVNTINVSGILEDSVMVGECDMYRQCGGLVRINHGVCRKVEMRGDMIVNTNSAAGIYDNRGVMENVRIAEISVTGTAAGIAHIARAGCEIKNCISLADLPGSNTVGGIRTVQAGATVSDVYFDNTISPISAGQGGTGYSTVDLQTPTSNTGIYANYDPAIWDFGTSSEYPKLTTIP